MLHGLFEMFAISIESLEKIDWTKLIIIVAAVSFVIACVISFLQMKKKYIDDVDDDNTGKKNKNKK